MAPTGDTIINNTTNKGLTVDLNKQVVIWLAALFVALTTGGLGVFFVNLRKPEKGVVEVLLVKVGIMMALIGMDIVTTYKILVDILQSAYEGWGVVVAMLQLVEIVISAGILYTVYGPVSARAYTGLHQLVDNVHMAKNPKMYALASLLTCFNLGVFILFPWKKSQFAERSFGLPNMFLFRTLQLTSIFTATLLIISQIPYLLGEDFSSPTKKTDMIFSIGNLVMQVSTLVVATLAYCVSASTLSESTTAAMETGSGVRGDPENGGVEVSTEVEMTHTAGVVPNPMLGPASTKGGSGSNAKNGASDPALLKKMEALLLEQQSKSDARFQEQQSKSDARFQEQQSKSDARFQEQQKSIDHLLKLVTPSPL